MVALLKANLVMMTHCPFKVGNKFVFTNERIIHSTSTSDELSQTCTWSIFVVYSHINVTAYLQMQFQAACHPGTLQHVLNTNAADSSELFKTGRSLQLDRCNQRFCVVPASLPSYFHWLLLPTFWLFLLCIRGWAVNVDACFRNPPSQEQVN